jgi:hypothetical protein
MTTELLEQAISFIKQGQKEDGRKILAGLLKGDPRLARAWAWLYECVETDGQRIYCLKKVIELNPNYKEAEEALYKLEHQQDFLPQKIPSSIDKPKQKGWEEHKAAIEKPKQKIVKQTKTVTKKPKQKKGLKQKQTIPIIEPEDQSDNDTKSKPPSVFDPKNYNIIYTRVEDNEFAEIRSSPSLPDNEGVMLGSRLHVGGISISPYDSPRCFEKGKILPLSECQLCDFFSAKECPFRDDPFLFQDTNIFYTQRKKYREEHRQEIEKRRRSVIGAIYAELKAHGRPLHYQVICKIMNDRYPQLKLTASAILHFMLRNPRKFEWLNQGVYKAK